MPSPQLSPGPNDAHTLPQTFYMGKFGELLQNMIPTPIQPILSSVWEPPETDHTRRCQAGLQRGFDPTLSNDPKSNAQPLKFDPGRRICAPLRVGNPRHTGSGRRRRPDPFKNLIGRFDFYFAKSLACNPPFSLQNLNQDQ